MPENVRYHWAAEAALQSLTGEEQQRVRAVMHRLGQGAYRDAPDVYRLQSRDGQGDLYVARAGEALRVLFTIDGDNLMVQDIINRRFAQQYG